jgi:hypothetical protein
MTETFTTRFPSSVTRTTAKQISAGLLIGVALLLPNRIGDFTPQNFGRLPLEALLLALLLAIPTRANVWLRWLAALVLGGGIVLKLLDLGVERVFGRPFNPVLDSRFPADGMQWLNGVLGPLGAGLGVAAFGLFVFGLIALFDLALRHVQAVLRNRPKFARLSLAALAAIWLGLNLSGSPVAGKPFVDWVLTHWRTATESLADLDSFQPSLDADPYANTPPQALFSQLRGKDVLVVFIESYGRTVFDRPDYAAHIRPLLAQGSANLAARGVAIRSAFLRSPTYGGISWLAHGTLLSGLWINSQSRYDRLVISRRASLNRLFQRAGWRTLAVQPAHTLPWPQGHYFGYDRIYAAQDLAYRGAPFNWITMPDQYTLAAVQKLERPPGPRQPIMAELALISSHAPWTPLPRLLDWQQVGDGSVFSQARDGASPKAVWQDTARIREQYRKSIEYVLATLVSFVKTYGDDKLVILILGDHQPVSFVTGDSPNHEVPVHLLSRDQNVIDAIASWHWTPGLIPAPDAPIWGMDALRDKFIRAFSSPQTP